MTTETAAKKDIQKLQRAIVDGLEDVKAQDIQVFNTEKLSALFERVMIASGTSNRQTKALAASVRDSVRDAGFSKPRMEGEENGEWIIVDCGAAVVHIMQPAIRQYYHLEDLWGESPVRLKFGADKPVLRAVVEKKEERAVTGSLRRSSAAQKGQTALAPAKKSSKSRTTTKSAPKSAPKRAGGAAPKKAAPLKTVTVNTPKPAAKKAAAKPASKPAATRTPAKPVPKSSAKPAAKKVAAKKAPARKSPSRKA
jgi:ribosome-associated protein